MQQTPGAQGTGFFVSLLGSWLGACWRALPLLVPCTGSEEGIVAGGAQKKLREEKDVECRKVLVRSRFKDVFLLPQVQTLLEHVGPQNLTLPSQTKEHMHDKKFATTFPSKRTDARARSLGPPKGNYFMHNRMGRPSSSLCQRNGDTWLSGKPKTRPFRNPSSPYYFFFCPPRARLPPPRLAPRTGQLLQSRRPRQTKNMPLGLAILANLHTQTNPAS